MFLRLGLTHDRYEAAELLAGEGTFHDEGAYPVDCDETIGRTRIDGLYIAGWISGQPHYVLLAAAYGVQVAKLVIHHHRLERGYWEESADYWDWSVEAGTSGDEKRHEHVDKWIDSTLPENYDISDECIKRVREALKEERLSFECSPAEREAQMEYYWHLLTAKFKGKE